VTDLIRVSGYKDRIQQFVADKTVIATLGNFDGLHLGHNQLFKRVSEIAGGLRRDAEKKILTGALSFYPHPAVVLGKAPRVPMLTSKRQKQGLLPEKGIDFFCIMRFTRELAEVLASDFCENILRDLFHVHTLVIGEDAAVGKDREGNVDFLRHHLPALGIQVEVVPFLQVDGARISSGRVRESLLSGDVDKASRLLGRCYSVDSKIVPGDGRGRTIGFPTANLHTTGVYAVRVRTSAGIFPGVVNIGVRPTFNGVGERVEVHILDAIEPPDYGDRIEVLFVQRIRDEKKFDSIDALKAQITLDVTRAKQLLITGERS
jgi:riboflavin kinase/FMN adenylyltransferase